jgi:Flp pilus assembly protein TadD
MLEEAVKLGVDSDISWDNLAYAYEKAYGNKDKAIQALERAIQFAKESQAINPKDAYSRSRLAYYYSKSEDRENALAEISNALELMPNNQYVLSISVQVYEILNQRDQAIQALKDYIEYGGSLKYLQTMPELSELRKDPRYKQLEKNKDLRD